MATVAYALWLHAVALELRLHYAARQLVRAPRTSAPPPAFTRGPFAPTIGALADDTSWLQAYA